MGGLDQVTDLAQQLTGKEQTVQDQQRQQESSQTTGRNQKWSEVGCEAKKVFAGYQADQSAGKGPEYNKVGGVVQKAFSAYSSGGEKRNLADIGKAVAAGFSSGEGLEKARNSDEVRDGVSESGGGQRSLGSDESNVNGGGGTRSQKSPDDPLNSTTAETKTGLTSERFSGREAPYKMAGLESQIGRDAQEGTIFEKADLDRDDGIYTGDQNKSREAMSDTAVNQGPVTEGVGPNREEGDSLESSVDTGGKMTYSGRSNDREE